MGPVSFSSPEVHVDVPTRAITAFAGDLNNLIKILPEQAVNFESNDSSCSFDISGMAHISLVKDFVDESKSVSMVSGESSAVDLKLVFSARETESGGSAAVVTLEADLSPFIQMLASSPLQNLVNIMAEKLAGAVKKAQSL
jgi:hypothetical protein